MKVVVFSDSYANREVATKVVNFCNQQDLSYAISMGNFGTPENVELFDIMHLLR